MQKLEGIILIIPARYIQPEWIKESGIRHERQRRYLAKHSQQKWGRLEVSAFILKDCDARFTEDGAVLLRQLGQRKFRPIFPPGVTIALWDRYEQHLAWNERYCRKCQLFSGHPIKSQKQPDRRRFQCGTPGCSHKWHIKNTDRWFA